MKEKEARDVLFISLIGLLATISFAFIILPQKQSGQWEQSATSKKTMASEVETSVLVAFIGDSVCAGAADDLKVDERWPQIVSSQNKWFAYNACVGGSGYINPGPDGKSTYKQVADGLFPKFNPAFIVIEGGQNDVASVNATGADMATEMSAAACDLYASIRKNYPTVKLIVMTPFYGVSQAPPVIGVQESAIKECAVKYNAKVISGVRKWLQDQPELFIADQTNPNGKGHALIAKKFLAWFKSNKF